MPDDDRRKADETFRYRIIEQQAEIKALLTQSREALENIKRTQAEQGLKITGVEHTLWGGPGVGDIGILEQHRRLAKNWTIAMGICTFIFSAVGKSVEPLLQQLVTSWTYNSTSERWLREQKRPKIKRYVIHNTPPPPKEESDSP